MKHFPVFSALLILFLLNGCFSGINDRSGLPDASELRESAEAERMTELKQDQRLRLGATPGTPESLFGDLRKKCAEKGLKLQIIPCREEWLTGFLRTGKLDLIYSPAITAERGTRMGFHPLPGGFLIRNLALHQYLYGP